MSAVNKEIVIYIENNPIDLYLKGVEILLKLLENVLQNPENEKYRKIRLENSTIKEKLISLNGMKNLLLSIGFQQKNNEFYILPPNTLLARIKNYRDFIVERREIIAKTADGNLSGIIVSGCKKKEPIVSKEKNSVGHQKSSPQMIFIESSRPYLQRISFPSVLYTVNQFIKEIESHSDHVMQYKDAKLLEVGKKIIPLEKLTIRAIETLRKIQKSIKKTSLNVGNTPEEPCLKDLILIELCNWFNSDFFEWVNQMPCKICGLTNNSKQHNAIENNLRVEIGYCCGVATKFYRFNDIVDLLKSRRGRCGEYANCFTFLCKCLDYEARIVYATFDHVWTEVYSSSQKRWIHFDPSDNVYDSPLMYQYGWKRNIDYVMAYSMDDIQDVTWRYTGDHEKVLLSRTKASELEVLNAIHLLREKRQQNISETRKLYLTKRNLKELVELMKPRQPTENEKKGRSSGSLTWRLDRGEESIDNFFIFEPNETEMTLKQFNLGYCCSTDLYERYIKDNYKKSKILEKYKGWQTAQFSSKNIFRKIEKDWKMVYLCRKEDTNYGEIIWKFDFKTLKIKSYALKFDKQIFENGQIELVLTDLNGHVIQNIRNASGFILKVNLFGGTGDCAWQHSQLFRQPLHSSDYTLDLSVEFY